MRVLVRLAVVIAVLAGCSGSDDDAHPGSSTTGPSAASVTSQPESSTSPAPTSAPPTTAPVQPLLADPGAWVGCGGGVECASLTVPVDHADPGGAALELAVARRPATGDRDERLGVILMNPGGPGGSGVQSLLGGFALPAALAERFDLVSWDPRGVGGSEALRCGGDELARWVHTDSAPDDATERQQLVDAAAALAESCGELDGALLPHMSTDDTVADMDRLRAALGEDEISYLGFSYGTYLGQVYLEAHPERVRAMVLDGVLDARSTVSTMADDQAAGFEHLLGELGRWCASRCAIDPVASFERLATQLELAPLDGGEVGPSELQVATAAALYSTEGWPVLVDALQRAEQGDGAALGAIAASYYDSASFTAYAAVLCLDFAPPDHTEGFDDLAARLDRYEHFGASLGYELLPCAFWPTDGGREPSPVTQPDGAPPVLLVAGIDDAPTSVDQARAVAGRLDGALVEVDSSTHTSFGWNGCVQDLATEYLVEGDLPPDGTTCPG